jgi:hypothetical protein
MLHGHYWAIVPLRRHSPRRAPRRLQLSDFVQSSVPNRRSGGSRRSNGVSQEGDQTSRPGQALSDHEAASMPRANEANPMSQDNPAPPSSPENEADPMILDNPAPPSAPEEDLSLVDQQLALNLLE